MNSSKGNISIHAQNIMPIIKRWLYSDKDIFVREMVSNGCDAITKQKLIAPADGCDYRVTVTLDKDAGEIRFSDNGIGMTAEEVKKYINQVAFSGAEEFLKNYEGDAKGGIIGHFGLGFYSAFMVADKVTIQTLSGSEGAEAVCWQSEDGMSFKMSAGERAERGTTVILHISDEEKEFLEEYKLREVLRRYCGFMSTPVYFDVVKKDEPKDADNVDKTADKATADASAEADKAVEKSADTADDSKSDESDDNSDATSSKAPELINDLAPLWLKDPKDCTEEEYKEFYRRVFHVYEDPLFYVHLNVDYPFNLKGILYFPKLNNDFGSREGEIKLFSGQVFVADNIKEVIPEFLMLLKGAIDCPDLPLNVSRSFLQNDGYVKKLSAYITRKVADKLTGLFTSDRENYQKYWEDINPFVKYGCMRDAKFFDQVKDTLLYKTTKGEYLTLTEYLAKNEGKLGKKVVYTNDPSRQTASIALYDAEGADVVVLDAIIDLNFVSFIEYSAGVDDLKFARVDADSDALVKEQTDEQKKQSETDEKALSELFKTATGNAELAVKISAFKDESVSAMLTQDEQGRRFSEMGKLYGQDFKMPEHCTLVLNGENPIVKALVAADDGEKRELIAAQLYDLARMSNRPLEKDEVTAFLTRSGKLLEMLCK